MQSIEFRLEADRIRYGAARRQITNSEWDRFATWVTAYRALTTAPRDEAALLRLGQEIYAWLNDEGRWMAELRARADSPVVAAFAVSSTDNEHDRLFLEVPWELAARGDTFLAADPALMWAPLRRIGATDAPAPPNEAHRLGVMFMAAAPAGETELNIDHEEYAILTATAEIGMDLTVEDTGMLGELARAWQAARTLDALHLSCHGLGGETPVLAFEDEDGECALIGLSDLAAAFAQEKPRLLFVSACHSGEGGPTVNSLARGLVGAGFPAVLGWANSVYDTDASAFAAAFYGRLAEPVATVESAWAAARFDLVRDRPGHHRPAHWHLARLFLGPRGGGRVATGGAPRLTDDPDAGRKAVLDALGRQIEVASRFEFVGRRRQSKDIQRTFRRKTHAGVLIQGLGRQGKSSLAARVIDRHPGLTPVVLFQACDGPSLLAGIERRIPGTAAVCRTFRSGTDPSQRDQYDPNALFMALRQLLRGPCGFRARGAEPMLLLLDDFEALLDPPAAGTGDLWRLKSEAEPQMAAIIRAFGEAATESRLLITSRYQFRLPDHGRDLTARLHVVPLPAMPPSDSLKQAMRKLKTGDADTVLREPDWWIGYVQRAVAAARGNAGLQDLLFQAALSDRDTGEQAIAALEAYLAGGVLPEQEALRDALERLAVETLLGLLTDDERLMLRTSLLFELPVPLSAWTQCAKRRGLGAPGRLPAFGLWDVLRDIAEPGKEAVAANAIVAARIPQSDSGDAHRLAADLLADVFTAWGGQNRDGTPDATDMELTRLALCYNDLAVLAATARFAIRGWERRSDHRQAAAVAAHSFEVLASGGHAFDPDFLRAAAEAMDGVGDAKGLSRIFALAEATRDDDHSGSKQERFDRSTFRLRYGTWLARQGYPDRALTELRASAAIFEELGDRRSRAVTLGDIARILTNKGEVEQALALHQEELKTYEELGDQDGIASANFDLGQIYLAKAIQDRDGPAFAQAFSMLEISYTIFRRIGRLDGIGAVGVVFGQALALAGQTDNARVVLARSRDGYRQLEQPDMADQVDQLLQAIE